MSKVIVVDLDGTLVNVNTFHKWMIFLFKKSLSHNLLDSIKILKIISLRLVKLNTHKQMKYRILQISENTRYKNYIDEFVNELETYINNEVLEYTKENNTITILATAAPALYAESIANKYAFTYCLATPETSTKKWFENIKERKRESLEKLLNVEQLTKVDIVLSDHHDDIPIMEMAESVFLVNASLDTKAILKKDGLDYLIISNIDS